MSGPTKWSPERIEDVVFMHETGEHPEMIAARMGVTVKALEGLARRQGMADLAKHCYSLHATTLAPDKRARRNAYKRRRRAEGAMA